MSFIQHPGSSEDKQEEKANNHRHNAKRCVGSDPWYHLDATAQSALVKNREVSPLELVEAAIKRIEALNPELNAVIHENYDQARQTAKKLTNLEGPFAGVPYLIKDLSELKGEPLEYGSALFKGFKARRDLGAVQRAKQAGLIILGKTNTPEFGLISTTEPVLHGVTRNPWDLSKNAAGSSGGAAAAVASGMVPMAHGSDGGGSIRIPASACGLVGLKPSRGRLFRVHREDTRLPTDIVCRLGLSRSVRDTAQLLNISEKKDITAMYQPVGMVTSASTKRLKIAFSTDSQLGQPAHPEVKIALEKTAQLCEDLGHHVEEAQPEANGDEFADHFLAIWASTPFKIVKYARLISLLQLRWTPPEQGLERWTRELAAWYRKREKQNPGLIPRANSYLHNLQEKYREFFTHYDVILSPVVRTPPVPVGEQDPMQDFDTLYQRVRDYASYTPQYNATGLPAISLPLYTSRDQLPIGSQFAARFGEERTLLELAYELEEACPWEDRWPELSKHYLGGP